MYGASGCGKSLIMDILNLKEQFIKAKENKTFIVKKSYLESNFYWEDILDFIYKETSFEGMEIENKKFFSQIIPEGNLIVTVKGNVSIHDPLWIKSLSGNVWNYLPKLKDFLYKINNDFNNKENFEDCSYYSGTFARYCSCNSIWHTEGMVVSLASRLVSQHRDAFDAGYVQLIGKSFWKIDDKEEICILNPGDLLLLPNELTHEVWGDGPRVGILLYKSDKNI
jgi:hypothetical protein